MIACFESHNYLQFGYYKLEFSFHVQWFVSMEHFSYNCLPKHYKYLCYGLFSNPFLFQWTDVFFNINNHYTMSLPKFSVSSSFVNIHSNIFWMGQDDGIIFVKRNLCFISFISLIVKLLFDVEKKLLKTLKVKVGRQ